MYLKPEEFQEVAHLADEPAAPRAHDPDGWRGLPLEVASINGKVGRLLRGEGLETLGQVADLMAKHGLWWKGHVKGVGEAGAAEVSDRFADFWRDHPEYCQSASA